MWCCDIFPCFKGISSGLGSWNPEFTICPFRARIWPFQAPKTLCFKGEMANFEAKNTIRQGKNAKRTNGTHCTRVSLPPPFKNAFRPKSGEGGGKECLQRSPSGDCRLQGMAESQCTKDNTWASWSCWLHLAIRSLMNCHAKV